MLARIFISDRLLSPIKYIQIDIQKEYAFRAKTIKNQPIVNQKQTKMVLMKEFMSEMENLRSQLQNTREKV